MTRKDFELIAATLRMTNASEGQVAAFATVLATTNSRFDYAQFAKAASQPV
jgi:hypothetical protein